MAPELEQAADRAPRHSVERLGGTDVIVSW